MLQISNSMKRFVSDYKANNLDLCAVSALEKWGHPLDRDGVAYPDEKAENAAIKNTCLNNTGRSEPRLGMKVKSPHIGR